VWCGNILFTTKIEEIKELFEEHLGHDSVEYINLPTISREDLRHKGFAFIRFKNKKLSQEAMSLHGKDLNGRNLILNTVIPSYQPVEKW
jgi:RNA recognition motif-containing protein